MNTASKTQAAILCEKALEIYEISSGRLVNAVEIWQEALQIDPNCIEAKTRLHYTLREQQAIIEEIQTLDSQLCDLPDNAALLYRAAYLRFVMGRDQEARTYWQKVIEKDDGDWAKSAKKMLRKKLGMAA